MNSSRQDTLDLLRRAEDDPRRRILIRDATVVTGDPGSGTLDRADVLLEGSTIAAIGRALPVGDAIVVNATGMIAAPGFVDTHRHAWEAQLRRIMPDVDDLGAYVTKTLLGYAPVYRPHDMYIGTKLAALTAIDAGITTMLDFSHNSRTAAHSDAAVRALRDTGIRGVHAAMAPHFGTWDHQWPADLTRLREQHTDDLLTFRLACLATGEIAGPDLAYGPRLARHARELSVGVSVDAVFGESSSRAILEWERQGLLGPEVTLIHATGLTADAWRAIADTGTTVALAPTSDAQIGLETAVPAVDEALAVGVRPGLSIDVEVALSSDMFTQMRVLLAIQRMRAVEGVHGTDRVSTRIGVADVLDFATVQGARTNGLERITGSLTPGKQADLLLITAEAINTMPLNDPIGTVVLGADARNVDTVLIGGRVRKWAGELLEVDLAALREEVTASRDHVLTAAQAVLR
ncbi:amidohydrolase family protein [Umezawaea beigongshangensis]|uniref:amidohydrolase family protein n=1 Tax=Umezawaea beigongshangensis TaxID=2780383 RepID=UPI0018F16DEF|nr:amidohydrolase family protein [Umezawaea beigongshangensis]